MAACRLATPVPRAVWILPAGAPQGLGHRIGQLTMRNLDIIDTRDKLRIYPQTGLIGSGAAGVPLLEEKKAD